MAEAAPRRAPTPHHKILLAGWERLTVLRPMPRKWGCTYAQFKVPIMTQQDTSKTLPIACTSRIGLVPQPIKGAF
jgi:hypothetical protein